MHEPDLEPHLSDILAGWRQIRRRGGKIPLPRQRAIPSLAALKRGNLILVLVLTVVFGCDPDMEKHAGWVLPLGGVILFCIFVCKFGDYWHTLQGYGFKVRDETVRRTVKFTSWQIVKVGALHGLAGKALLIRLQGKTLFPHVKLPRSFGTPFYSPEREVRYRVRVCGFDETGECELVNHLAFNGDGVIPMSGSAQASDGCALLLPIYQRFPRYELEIRLEDADGLAPREDTCIKQLFLKMSVALPAKEIGRADEVSIRNAQVTIVDED